MKELNWYLHFPIEVGFLLLLNPKKLFIALFPCGVEETHGEAMV